MENQFNCWIVPLTTKSENEITQLLIDNGFIVGGVNQKEDSREDFVRKVVSHKVLCYTLLSKLPFENCTSKMLEIFNALNAPKVHFVIVADGGTHSWFSFDLLKAAQKEIDLTEQISNQVSNIIKNSIKPKPEGDKPATP